MDLGIAGRRAIVCASSRGLGRACAEVLAREGVAVVVNGRHAGPLEETAAALRDATGAEVMAVAADLDVAADRARLVAACPDADILVNNNAGPPPGRFEDWGHAEWLRALEANLLAPLAMIHALLPGMQARGFGRIVNITSAMVKTPLAPRAHRAVQGPVPAGRPARGHHQQPAARADRHGPAAPDGRARLEAAGNLPRGGPGGPGGEHPGRPPGPPGGGGRGVRLPVQRSRRVHLRPERPARRGCLRGPAVRPAELRGGTGPAQPVLRTVKPRRGKCTTTSPARGSLRRSATSSGPTCTSVPRTGSVP
jgi:hypothetical protein